MLFCGKTNVGKVRDNNQDSFFADYIFGGAFMVLGIFMLLIEYLLSITFALNLIGWSIYPLVVLLLFGGMLTFLGINSNIREKLERRFFF